MSKPDNTRQWHKGDYVLHYADAKHPKMLMRVVGFKRDDKTLAKCQYVSKKRNMRGFLWNDVKNLHDPEKWGINPAWGKSEPAYFEQICEDWECVRLWNFYRKPGQRVVTSSADGGFITKTTGLAKIGKDGNALIPLERGGWWALEFVTALRDEPETRFLPVDSEMP